jgi:DNA polymerase I
MKKIYLVDVSSMFFRAFYAVRPLNALDGTPVNAVYGFVSMVVKLLKEKNPEYVAFCYDRKEPSFRKELDENYKANRTVMPDDLQVQMPYIKQVASLFGIMDIEIPSFEADDIIGTLACHAKQNDFQAVIVSGDKDFCQLVNENVVMYDTMKETITNPASVIEKYGVTAAQFIDYLAITGDTSDNIKGVAGIGPKGAQKLIQDFGSLDNIYKNLDKISSASTRAKLEASKADVFLAQKLVTISTDAPIGKKFEDFKRTPMKTEELRAWFQKLNFKTFEKTVLDDAKVNYSEGRLEIVINSKVESDAGTPVVISDESSTYALNAVDISEQTWDEAVLRARLQSESGFVFTHKDEVAFGFGSQLFYKKAVEITDHTLFNQIKWSGYDLKHIWQTLTLSDEVVAHAIVDWDLMIGAYALKASDTSDLEKLSKNYLKHEFKLKDIETMDLYKVLLQLNNIIKPLSEQTKSDDIYEKLDKPLIKILHRMESNGIRLDVKRLKEFSGQLGSELAVIEAKIHEIAGEKFNIGSPKQLGVILFEKLGLEALKKTKTGYSTDNDVLEKLKHPIGQQIIEYRELAKLKSTYVDALPELVDSNNRVHGSFNQALTATGRLSSTAPNLQNIPIKTEKGQVVRQCFIADEGKKLLSLDYSQIELRVLAHISGDRNLIQAFADDLDIHQATAAEVFSTPLKEVTKDQRRIAKAVNFGIAYGQGAFGLAETLGISRSESKEIIEKYFNRFSGIKEYIDTTIEQAHKNKYVETLFGRKRYIDELNSINVMVKKFGERAAINAPIQGTASDLVKLAMIDIAKNIDLKLILQVHDELIFEGVEEEILKDLPKIKYKMENVAKLKVPLKVNHAIGNNWDQSH